MWPPMAVDIAMGVRRGNFALREQIDKALEQDKPEIDALLRAYHVPQALN